MTRSSFALRTQHNSLQFSDSPKQQEHDIRKIFVQGTRYPIKTGTEAGQGAVPNANRELLEEFAEEFNHAINFGGDSWVAIDRSIIKPRSLERGDVFLASNDEMKTAGHNRVMPWLGFDHINDAIGRVYQGSVHYPTKGATPGSPNWAVNNQCAKLIAQWMMEVGKGHALAFVNGDFNMNDRTLDVAIGRAFTSMADELKAWQNTGHGPIDGMCSYDRDGRTHAKRFTVLDDSEFHLFSDHFTCRGTWEIESLLRED